MLVDDRELTERAVKIDALLEELESFLDPAIRAKATEIVEGLLLLYGQGLARTMAIIADQAAGSDIAERLANDDLVSHLLLLHDLHPLSPQERVTRALEEVRPYLKSHGGNVQLLGVEDGIAKLRLEGSCKGCPSSTMTLKLAIEEAIRNACPDLDGIDAEGVSPEPASPAGFIPMSSLLTPKGGAHGPAWTPVEGLSSLGNDDMAELQVSGELILFCSLDDTFLAYRGSCPDCGTPLAQGALADHGLTCSGCRHTFDIRTAGRCIDKDGLHLIPVPLLTQRGTVKVALNQA